MMVFGAVGGLNNPCHFTGRFHRRFPLQFFPRVRIIDTGSLVYGSAAHAQWVGVLGGTISGQEWQGSGVAIPSIEDSGSLLVCL